MIPIRQRILIFCCVTASLAPLIASSPKFQAFLPPNVRLITKAVRQIILLAPKITSIQFLFLFPQIRRDVSWQWTEGLVDITSAQTLQVCIYPSAAANITHGAVSLRRHSSGDEFVVTVVAIAPPDIPVHLHGESSSERYHILTQTDYQPGLLEAKAISRLRYKVQLEFLNGDVRVEQHPEIVAGPWSLRIRTLCFYCDGGRPQLITIPVCSLENASIPMLFPDFSSNMNGTILSIVSSKGLERSISFQEAANGTIELQGGFSNSILRCLQRKYNFSYKVGLRNGFGKKLQNGTFTGIVGALQSEEAEYTMDIGSSTDRFQTVTFLPMTVYAGAVFFTRIPSQVTDWNLVHRPFEMALWILLLFCISGVGFVEIMLVVIGRFVRKDSCDISYKNAYGKSVGYLLRHLLEQSEEDPMSGRYKALKAVGIAWVFSAVIISTAYKAKLTTLRSYAPEEDVPRNFEELANSNYKIILHHVGGIFLKGFETSTNLVLQRVAKRLVLEKSLLKCFQLAVTSNAACVTMNINGVFAGYKNFSSVNGELMLRMSDDQSFPLLGGPATKKGAIFSNGFSKTIRQMFDMGLVRRFQDSEDNTQRHNGKLWAKGLAERESWRQGQHEGPQPIVISELLVLYLVVSTLSATSALVFIGEVYCRKISCWSTLYFVDTDVDNYDPVLGSRSSVTSDTFTIVTLLDHGESTDRMNQQIATRPH